MHVSMYLCKYLCLYVFLYMCVYMYEYRYVSVSEGWGGRERGGSPGILGFDAIFLLFSF